jgi:tetratricopeptide (TPR) repeat protein
MIADHLSRYLPAGGDGATEEGLGGRQITVLSQQHIHHLAVLVDRPIKVALLGATEEECEISVTGTAEVALLTTMVAAVSYDRLGDLAVDMGRSEEAARLFSQTLDISRRLAEAETDRADYQRDLSVSYERLGELARSMGRGEEAGRRFTQALDIARRLAAQQPASADAAVDVAISLIQMASVSIDPAHERGEARAILGHLRGEGRLPPHGERLLAHLEEEPGTGAHP